MKKWKTQSGHDIFQILSGRCNVFILSNGKRNIMIDTSVSRLWDKLQEGISNLGISAVDFLILTHAHFDHAGNVYNVKKKYKSVIIAQKEDAGPLSSGQSRIPQGTNPMTRFISGIGKRFSSHFQYQPCTPDLLFESNLNLKELGFNAYLMHTPGHSAGSVSLIIDNEIAIVGDTLFGIFKGSLFPPYADNECQMLKSWKKLLETDCVEFIPSHGSSSRRSLLERDYRRRVKKV